MDTELPNLGNEKPLAIKSKSGKRRKIVLWVVSVSVLLLLLLAGGAFLWYKDSLKAIDSASSEAVQVVIPEGASLSEVASQLESKGLIKSALAVQIYHKINNAKGIHSGTYTFTKQQTPAQILLELQNGVTNEFQITFKPGENIFNAKEVLKKAGYGDDEIEAALKKQYSKYAMMSGRPVDSNVEGFILGETYGVTKDYTVENVLDKPFSLLQEYINKEGLEEAFKKRGLSLYQGIILASIIQREVSNPDDMLLVSSVFHNRLKQGMPLGSDVTAAYGVKVLGKSTSVVEAVTIDTPYNTRIHKGLPPTPIASPGMRALRAAANPAESSYLYFVAGDDGKTYFATTNQEHEQNTRDHCDKLCKL